MMLSLRLRLALWYGGLTGLIILLLGFLAYVVYSRAQYDNLDHALEGAVEHVVGTQGATVTDHEAMSMLMTPILPNVAIRVVEGDGRVLAASPNADTVPRANVDAILAAPSPPAYDHLGALVPSFSREHESRGAFGLVAGPDGRQWRVYVLPSDGEEYFVASASLESIEDALATFRRLVPLLAALGGAVTVLTGSLLVGSALRPVSALTETAGAIARSRAFDHRVPVGKRHDELGQLADTFNEMLTSLEQAYLSQQRFVGDASHELRAPLTAIQANLELLERQRGMSEEERQEAIREAGRETRRLARLVADLLALARADTGLSLHRHPVELDTIVLDAFRTAQALVNGQRLVLETLEPVQVGGDADRLKQLLLILLDNALKYTPLGGEVTLAMRRVGGQVELRVQDTGVGIAASELPHVFERFYRADPARGRDPGGTGLGLPIARWLVDQHEGEITVHSEPAHGTTVIVCFPSAPEGSRPVRRGEVTPVATA